MQNKFQPIKQIFKQLNNNQPFAIRYWNSSFPLICKFQDTYNTKKFGKRHRIKFLINADNYKQTQIENALNQFKTYCQQNNIKYKISTFRGGQVAIKNGKPYRPYIFNFINISAIY